MTNCCQYCKNACKRRSNWRARSFDAELGCSSPRSFRFPFTNPDHGVAGQPVASTQTLNRKKLIQCSQTASFGPRNQSAQTTPQGKSAITEHLGTTSDSWGRRKRVGRNLQTATQLCPGGSNSLAAVMRSSPDQIGKCRKTSRGCGKSDHKVRLTPQNAVDKILREVHGGGPFRIEVRRINAAVDAPGAKMSPPTSPLGLTWQYRCCTAIAADCGKTLLMERIQDYLVLGNVGFQLLIGEIRERVDSQTVQS